MKACLTPFPKHFIDHTVQGIQRKRSRSMVGHRVIRMFPLQMVLKMATNCRGHLVDGPIGPPRKYFAWFRLGRVRGFRISSLCTNFPVYYSFGARADLTHRSKKCKLNRPEPKHVELQKSRTLWIINVSISLGGACLLNF